MPWNWTDNGTGGISRSTYNAPMNTSTPAAGANIPRRSAMRSASGSSQRVIHHTMAPDSSSDTRNIHWLMRPTMIGMKYDRNDSTQNAYRAIRSRYPALRTRGTSLLSMTPTSKTRNRAGRDEEVLLK